MKLIELVTVILFLCILFCECSTLPRKDLEQDLASESVVNGSTYRITSFDDQMVITVLPDGQVIGDVWKATEAQLWTIVVHPFENGAMEFKNSFLPYNDLSGWDPLDTPGIFPRPLFLNKYASNSDDGIQDGAFPIPWQILIRNRWCLQSNGVGRVIDIDDCDGASAPWQMWRLQAVAGVLPATAT